MFTKFTRSEPDSLSQAPVEIPPLVLTECSRTEDCAPSSPEPSFTPACDPSENDSECDAEDEYVYVLTIDGHPACFFDYKSRALKYMRNMARELCVLSLPFLPVTYSVVRHHNEDHIDVIRRMNNVLISYDQIVRSFRLTRVYKKNTV
jgi:hypothetical protein